MSEVGGMLEDYHGSRNQRSRLAYENNELIGFAEMTPEWSSGKKILVIDKFKRALLSVPGVTSVRFHPKGNKALQLNKGNHYQHHNFVVTSKKTGNRWIEFELTRNQHVQKDIFTVSACIKQPKKPHIEEGWRILLAACRAKIRQPSSMCGFFGCLKQADTVKISACTC